jgi:hypothetical protein
VRSGSPTRQRTFGRMTRGRSTSRAGATESTVPGQPHPAVRLRGVDWWFA